MSVRILGLALFSAALVAIAMSQEVSISRVAQPAVQAQTGPVRQAGSEGAAAGDPAAPAEQSQALVVPDIEGESYDRAIELLGAVGFEISVFDATHHGAAVADFEPATADPYVTAVLPEAGQVSEDGSVDIAVSWDRTGLPDAARRDPWWWPGHIAALQGADPPACAPCHEELGCTTCHVNRAHLYLKPGADLPGADAASVP